MGKPDNRHIKNSSRGFRIYVEDNLKYDQQRGVRARNPAFRQNDEIYKQSEFKKPYQEDTYEEMEYYGDSFPGFSNDYRYDTPFDNTGVNNIDPFSGTNPWKVVFLCSTDACWGIGEANCEDLNCGWPVVGSEITYLPAGCNVYISAGQICAECPDGTAESIIVNITMKATFKANGKTVKVTGTHYGISISKCVGLCDDTGIAIAWDETNLTVAQSSSVGVDISDSTGLGGPYSWSVSGTGFTMANATTTGTANTLITDATACGTATITIIGCDGNTISGIVKCTTGVWTLISTCQGGNCTQQVSNCDWIEKDQRVLETQCNNCQAPFCTPVVCPTYVAFCVPQTCTGLACVTQIFNWCCAAGC